MIGDRITFGIKISVSSDAPISVYPTWEYSERVIKDKKFSRTQGGQLNSFRKKGVYYEFNLPLDYVSSADAHTINQWWREQTDLTFILNNELDDQQSIETRLVNLIPPLNQNVYGDSNMFKGLMILRSITDVGFETPAFTLDDPVFGVLDNDKLG